MRSTNYRHWNRRDLHRLRLGNHGSSDGFGWSLRYRRFFACDDRSAGLRFFGGCFGSACALCCAPCLCSCGTTLLLLTMLILLTLALLTGLLLRCCTCLSLGFDDGRCRHNGGSCSRLFCGLLRSSSSLGGSFNLAGSDRSSNYLSGLRSRSSRGYLNFRDHSGWCWNGLSCCSHRDRGRNHFGNNCCCCNWSSLDSWSYGFSIYLRFYSMFSGDRRGRCSWCSGYCFDWSYVRRWCGVLSNRWLIFYKLRRVDLFDRNPQIPVPRFDTRRLLVRASDESVQQVIHAVASCSGRLTTSASARFRWWRWRQRPGGLLTRVLLRHQSLHSSA